MTVFNHINQKINATHQYTKEYRVGNMGSRVQDYISRKLNLLVGPFGHHSRVEDLPVFAQSQTLSSQSKSRLRTSENHHATAQETPEAHTRMVALSSQEDIWDFPARSSHFGNTARVYTESFAQTDDSLIPQQSLPAVPMPTEHTQSKGVILGFSNISSVGVIPLAPALLLEEGTVESPVLSPSTQVEGDDSTGPPPFTDGPSEVILVPDGTKKCLALVLTESMVAKLSQVTRTTCVIEQMDRMLNDSRMELELINSSVEQLKSECETTKDRKALKKLWKEISDRETKLPLLKRRIEDLEVKLSVSKMNLNTDREWSHEALEEVLKDAELIEEPDAEEIANEIGMEDEPQVDTSTLALIDNESVISIDELNRRSVWEEYDRARHELHELQVADYNREENAHQELQEFLELVRKGEAPMTREKFDHYADLDEKDLDEALERAEAAFAEARVQAVALNLVGNEPWQESDFVDDPDDGCADTEIQDDEEEMKTTVHKVNDSKINKWLDRVSDMTEEPQDPEPAEDMLEDEEITTVNISDSISCHDAPPAWRKRIDRWNKINGRDR